MVVLKQRFIIVCKTGRGRIRTSITLVGTREEIEARIKELLKKFAKIYDAYECNAYNAGSKVIK